MRHHTFSLSVIWLCKSSIVSHGIYHSVRHLEVNHPNCNTVAATCCCSIETLLLLLTVVSKVFFFVINAPFCLTQQSANESRRGKQAPRWDIGSVRITICLFHSCLRQRLRHFTGGVGKQERSDKAKSQLVAVPLPPLPRLTIHPLHPPSISRQLRLSRNDSSWSWRERSILAQLRLFITHLNSTTGAQVYSVVAISWDKKERKKKKHA